MVKRKKPEAAMRRSALLVSRWVADARPESTREGEGLGFEFFRREFGEALARLGRSRDMRRLG